MPEITWDEVGDRFYETGVDRGVLYIPDADGAYSTGVPWNGLTTLTEKPTGASASPQYADNIKYLNLIAAEEFGGTIQSFTYPDEFAVCDGTASPSKGLNIGQQTRKQFGLSYRSRVGNDVASTDLGYKLHLVYNALAAPSEKAFASINDSPAAIEFSWDFTTTPVDVPGFKPSALITVDSTKVSAAALAELETILYGSDGTDGTGGSTARLPLPAEIITLFATDDSSGS